MRVDVQQSVVRSGDIVLLRGGKHFAITLDAFCAITASEGRIVEKVRTSWDEVTGVRQT